MGMMKFNVGYYDFSADTGMNFQLNRFYSMGILDYEEVKEIGRKADDFEKWISLFTEKGKQEENKEDRKSVV